MTEADVATLTGTFRLLGDATRVRILDALAHAELCVGDLAALLGLSESAVSHQLRLLRSLRLVRPRREGRMVVYTLDDQRVMALFQAGLGHVGDARGRALGRPAGDSPSDVPSGRRVSSARSAEEDPDGALAPRGKVE